MLTSPSTIWETPPSASISRLVSSTHCATVSTNVTRAPCRARTTAVARPLPMPSAREPAPVTMATLPLRRSSLRIAVAISLEHAVGVGGFFGNILHDIPMLDNLGVLKPEDIDDRAATAPFLAHAVDVQDRVIPVRQYTFDLVMRVRKFFTQESQECLKAVRPIRPRRIVLDVARPNKFRRGIEVFLVKRLLVEFKHSLRVGLLCRSVSRECWRCYEGEDTDKADDD